ncbi:MAG: tryptophan 7-halogenase [Planctomycetes bacterium]|nr:tryptophan 7-halogenase [Planctomycetota bacterium]
MRIGIIGGGPGGAVAAATLARAGHQVEVWEAEVFPRFHIGESLLPCNLPIYEDLGLGRDIFASHGYTPKLAAHFEQAGTGRTCRFPFADGLPGDPPGIHQVERARFDHMLLQHAVASGAQLHCPVRVQRVDLPERGQPVIHHDHGATAVDFVIDASGRETLLGRQLGLVDREGDLMRAAVYGHVGAIPLAPGAERGDISIAKGEAGWAWAIPLAPDAKWSVGMVLKRDAVIKGGSPAEVFRNNLVHFPEYGARLAGQVPEPVRATPNISYRVRQRVGRRWALIGDAGGFADPIFSSGVLLATRAGWHLGKRLAEHGADVDLASWRAQTDHDLATFIGFIRLWYDGHFIDNLFFSETREVGVYRGIISLLAGNTTNPDNVFLSMLQRRMRKGGEAGS